jgi:hypothetical protein
VHHGYPVARRLGGVAKPSRFASPKHLTTVGALQSCDDFDQGRLPGPVFAHQKMNFAGGHLQIAVLERDNAAEPLLDISKL